MAETKTEPAIYLASKSPRRRELLAQVGVDFEPVPAEVDERPLPDEEASAYVRRVALDKARAAWRGDFRRPVLGADTAVVLDDRILGKPRDRAAGLAMLKRLSGRTHEVYSAVAVKLDDREATSLSVSQVTFRDVAPWERLAYWNSGEPRDKAGGYAIQGLAAVFISRLEGSYSGVMGLPLFETVELLAAFGVPVPDLASGAGERDGGANA